MNTASLQALRNLGITPAQTYRLERWNGARWEVIMFALTEEA